MLARSWAAAALASARLFCLDFSEATGVEIGPCLSHIWGEATCSISMYYTNGHLH